MHQEVREQLKDHEKRIGALERSDAEMFVKIEALVEKLDQLVSMIKALIFSIITVGVGFIIWYIQSLPR